MINRIATSNVVTLPIVLRYTDIRSYVFTVAFVLLNIAVPWVFHQFYLAGPTYLPMHIFVLVAGLVYGWRAGLVVGLLTPITSHAVSGMPVLTLLPQITSELLAYGLIAGLLREKFNLRVIWSLLGAIVGGRLVLLLAMWVIVLITGQSNSPLGLESSPFLALWSIVKQGWPGIVIQLGSIPILIFLIDKFLIRKRTS